MSKARERTARRAGERTTRAQRRLVAVLERRGRFLTAEPLFPREREPAAARRRGRAERIVLGSGGAVQVAGGGRARPGEMVLVDLPRRGSPARVARLIGSPAVARELMEALMLDRGLQRSFPEDAAREAASAAAVAAEHAAARRDLRELPTFTIDPVSARDFDDAVSAETLGPGETRVWVHIADVAAHVREGGALDREALRRGTSVYVPGAVEPMLPHALSSSACSLMPHVDRLAVTVELELAGAEVRRASFYRSLVRSDARLDYEQVDRIFAGAEQALDPWRDALAAARAAAAELGRERERRGALVVESEEPEFEFDASGAVVGIAARAQTESHRLIEHLMIAANEAVAGQLAARGVPCLYRVHERPDPQRIERLVEQLASLDVPTPPVPERMSSTQAAELVGHISSMIEAHVARSGRGGAALNSLVLRSLKQAYYSPQNLGHAGLSSSAYCHFTSPIRRYPDIVCHRALLSTLGTDERAPRAGELAELGEWTSEREREAMDIERAADDVARCFALERVLLERGREERFEGEVSGLIPAGAFVVFGPDGDGGSLAARGLAFEGMLPVRMMRAPARESTGAARAAASAGGGVHRRRGARGAHGGVSRRALEQERGVRDWWELNEEGTILHGSQSGATVRLGDPIAVRVERIDTVRGRVDLVPA